MTNNTDAQAQPGTSALAEKYAIERDKRYKARAKHQWLSVRDIPNANLAKDHFIDYARARANEPQVKDGDYRRVAIIGAGHSGILFAVRLIQAGISAEDILLIDTAGGYGGVWYWNRYPGLMCDVESYIYLPLLEETNYVPKHKYSYGAEIRNNSEMIAEKYHLQGLFTTTATKMEWSEDEAKWTTHLTRDLGPGGSVKLAINSQYLLIAAGPITEPKMPDVAGIDGYLKSDGHIFHTARWDYGQTGGSQDNPELTSLRGKKVAVVGTGATAVQVIPEVAKHADKLYVLQRTPSYVGLRGQKETDPTEWAEVAKGNGWQQARAGNFNLIISNEPQPRNLVGDGWTETGAWAAYHGGKGKYPFVTPDVVQDHIQYFLDLDTPRANRNRALIDKLISDKGLAEHLKPWYPGWCKRPVFNDNYFPTFTQPNVQLVDLEGKSIEKFTSKGVVANGAEIDVDLVILATGFETPPEASAATRSNALIFGRNGKSLDDKWTSPEFGTLHGYMTTEFPNLFFQGSFGQAIAFNLTSIYDIQAKHCAFLIQKADTASQPGRKTIIEAPIEAEREWNNETTKRSLHYSTLPLCTPGYFTGDAQAKIPETPEEIALASKRTIWPGGATDFSRRLAQWRYAGEWKKLIKIEA